MITMTSPGLADDTQVVADRGHAVDRARRRSRGATTSATMVSGDSRSAFRDGIVRLGEHGRQHDLVGARRARRRTRAGRPAGGWCWSAARTRRAAGGRDSAAAARRAYPRPPSDGARSRRSRVTPRASPTTSWRRLTPRNSPQRLRRGLPGSTPTSRATSSDAERVARVDRARQPGARPRTRRGPCSRTGSGSARRRRDRVTRQVLRLAEPEEPRRGRRAA